MKHCYIFKLIVQVVQTVDISSTKPYYVKMKQDHYTQYIVVLDIVIMEDYQGKDTKTTPHNNF